MRRLVRQARCWFFLLVEILLLAALHRFDDWRYATMPIKFVETAVLCGIAFFAAASSFSHVSLGRKAGVVFWVVAIILRIVALPARAGRRPLALSVGGKSAERGLQSLCPRA